MRVEQSGLCTCQTRQASVDVDLIRCVQHCVSKEMDRCSTVFANAIVCQQLQPTATDHQEGMNTFQRMLA